MALNGHKTYIPLPTTPGMSLGIQKKELNINIQHKVIGKVLFNTCSLFAMMEPRNPITSDTRHGGGLQQAAISILTPVAVLHTQHANRHSVALGLAGETSDPPVNTGFMQPYPGWS